MNRRTFFGGAVAGVGGLIFPRVSEGEHVSTSDEFILKGITNEAMLRKIAGFPQSAKSTLFYSCWQDMGYPEPPPSLILCDGPLPYFTLERNWEVEGTSIWVTSVQYPRPYRRSEIRFTSLYTIRLREIYGIKSTGDEIYKRVNGPNGSGWILVEG